jgi:C4-dicarboxylate transporter DctQ subunit
VGTTKPGKIWTALEENSIALLLLVTTAILFINVILRYFFKMSLFWVEEFIRYAMIWISFVGAAVCFRRGIHFGVDLILRVKSRFFVRAVRIVIETACFVFCGFLLKYSVDLVLFSREMGQISPAMRVPLWVIYIIIPLTSLLALLYEGARIFTLCAGGEPPSGLSGSAGEEPD